MAARRTSRREFLGRSAKAASALIVSPSFVRLLSGAEKGKGEWISLFDGRTLDGWHKNPQRIQHGTGGRWVVEDGMLTGEQDPPGSGNGGILLTDQKFGDFELLIDMKPDWGVDTGLFLRCNDKGQCFQVMVDYPDNQCRSRQC